MRVFENGAINGMDLDLQCPPPFNPHGGGGEPPPSFQTATSPMNPYGQCGGGVRGGGAGQFTHASSMSINQSSCAVPMSSNMPSSGGPTLTPCHRSNRSLQHSASADGGGGGGSWGSGGPHPAQPLMSGGCHRRSQQSIHYHQHEEQCPHHTYHENNEFKYKEAPS